MTFRCLLHRTLLPLLSLAAAVLHAQEMCLIRDTGPSANRVNLVILGDGYVASESAKFFSDAQQKLSAIVDNEAFAPFKDVINGYAIFAASNQSGTDIPSQGITRDTYFNTSFGISGIDRLLAINDNTGMTRLNALLTQYVPDRDIVVLVVNSTKYGGSGGSIAVVSLDPASDDVILHEIGHSFAGLSDEYVDTQIGTGTPAYESVNITQRTDRNTIVWNNFILATTPIPTTGFSSDPNYVGAFEGGYYRATGYYRPTYDSKMRSLGRPFGPVNLRAFASALQRLNLNNATATPTFTAQPVSQSVVAGGTVTLSATVSGTGPYTYQWLFNGKYIAGATSATYAISGFSSAKAGDYRVEITNTRGSVTSSAATLAVAGATDPARLAAISCRAVVGTGSDVLIPGMLVGGAGQKQVIVRVSGPAIQGVSNKLAQPQLKFYQGGISTPIATNTGWSSGTSAETAALQNAFTTAGLPQFPLGSADCALLATVNAGAAYTTVVSGLSNTTGVALVEVYELGNAGARLTALSCRAQVGTGDNILIPGISISGTTPKQLLFRASAPAGVAGVLAQPQLTLYNNSGAIIASNTGWSTAANAATIFAVTPSCGLTNFPSGSPNCAILITLSPGLYTAQVRGVNDSTGVALVEVYEVP